jgi:hypothetical protein
MTELERSLVALGRELAVPEVPDLTPRVLATIGPRRRRLAAPSRRLVLAFALVALALLGATLAIPDARSALLRIFDIGAERIEIVDELPEIPVADLESTLGERVTLDEARDRSTFPLRELETPPDRVYLGEHDTVWFLYGDPVSPRLLVAQTPFVRLDEPALVKKIAGEGTRVESVSVGGARGVFLSGDPHFFFYVDENGDAVSDTARLARDTLVWSEAGVGYRIEGDFGTGEALELAESLRQRR